MGVMFPFRSLKIWLWYTLLVTGVPSSSLMFSLGVFSCISGIRMSLAACTSMVEAMA